MRVWVGVAAGLKFTEAGEFARGIHVQQPDEEPASADASHMGVDEPDPAPTPAPAPEPARQPQWGAWVAASEGGEAAAAEAPDEDMADAEEEEGDAPSEDQNIARERPVGSGALPRWDFSVQCANNCLVAEGVLARQQVGCCRSNRWLLTLCSTPCSTKCSVRLRGREATGECLAAPSSICG